ncbi:hypothetical protein BA195_09315 [Tenacibaculum soleae]|uniref:O-antigen polymerase n=2 Tax=Tenacibaculum soleae TaxID=447689 RepID=A0A1B9XZZ6_9FLAO|nr:hypothetical protein BA195_09315 [Tenacibaculum soleae]
MLAVGIVLFLGALLKPKFINDSFKLLVNRKIAMLFVWVFVMIAFNIVISLIHSTFDLSYNKNLISQIVQIVMVIFVISYIFYDYKGDRYTVYLGYLIVWAFLMQSVVEIVAFIVPAFASVVHLTYKAEQIELMYEGYGGVRGLALTGSAGWGLAVGFGFAFLFFFKLYIVNKKATIFTIILGLILVLGAFFAGRSSFVGAILGVVYYIFSQGKVLIKLRNVFFGIALLVVCIMAVYFLLPAFSELLLERVFPFVFEFYYKYESSGVAQTGSTNKLMEMWSVPISSTTFFIGDGVFTDPITGKYYMLTDVGYIRNLLFGGFFWVVLVISYHFYISSVGILFNKKVIFNDKLFIVFLLLYMLILEAKAMSLGYNKYAFIILVLYLIAWIYEKNNKSEKYIDRP